MTDDVLAPDAAEQDKSADQASATTEPDEGAASPQAAPRRKRRILKRIAIGTVSTVVVLALLLAGLLTWEIRRAFPQYDGALNVPGLTAPVTVYRDESRHPAAVRAERRRPVPRPGLRRTRRNGSGRWTSAGT